MLDGYQSEESSFKKSDFYLKWQPRNRRFYIFIYMLFVALPTRQTDGKYIYRIDAHMYIGGMCTEKNKTFILIRG